MVCVVRTALTWRWLPRHVLMLALVATLSLLGRWQWDVSESARGGIQNFLYAFQWWFMAAMVIYGWWRLLRDAAYPHLRPTPKPAPTQVADGADSWYSNDASRRDDAWYTKASYAAAGRSSASADNATDEMADDDADLAAYNEYLARLNDRAEHTH